MRRRLVDAVILAAPAVILGLLGVVLVLSFDARLDRQDRHHAGLSEQLTELGGCVVTVEEPR